MIETQLLVLVYKSPSFLQKAFQSDGSIHSQGILVDFVQTFDMSMMHVRRVDPLQYWAWNDSDLVLILPDIHTLRHMCCESSCPCTSHRPLGTGSVRQFTGSAFLGKPLVGRTDSRIWTFILLQIFLPDSSVHHALSIPFHIQARLSSGESKNRPGDHRRRAIFESDDRGIALLGQPKCG